MKTRASRKAAHTKPRRARVKSTPRARSAAPPTLLPSLARHETLEGLAYRDIRKAIMAGRLAPGERVVANAIAAAAGVSRIPVMQALRRLESEGFVRITPHKDVVVTGLSADEFRERFLMMAALEALCVREARARISPALLTRLRALQREMAGGRAANDAARAVAADSEFHRLLWEASGLRQVIQTLQNVWDRGEYYRVITHARRGGFARESLAEHEQILRALEDGDADRAARAIEHHRMQAMGRLAETT